MRALTVEDEVFASPPDLSEAHDLPGHVRIAAWLEGLIAAGRLEAGDRLPAEVRVAAALGVSRMTLRQALAGLEAKGLLERRRGRSGGSFVTEPRVDVVLAGLAGFTEQMRRAHISAGAHVVRAAVCAPAADVRAALRLRRGDQVVEVVRVRSVDEAPVALEEAFLPASGFPGLLDHDLTGSLYDVMERAYDRRPHTADEVVEPVKATVEQAELLGVAPDDVLLLVVRTSYDEAGRAVEHSFDRFRPDRTRLVLRTRLDGETSTRAEPLPLDEMRSRP